VPCVMAASRLVDEDVGEKPQLRGYDVGPRPARHLVNRSPAEGVQSSNPLIGPGPENDCRSMAAADLRTP
jgi:hypothetical protein